MARTERVARPALLRCPDGAVLGRRDHRDHGDRTRCRGWQAAGHEHRTSADAIRSAEQILAERLARGDIDEETYRRQRDLIRASQHPRD
jgi:hypothetical protein